MAKAKSLNFIVPLVVYPFDVAVIINKSNDETVRFLKKKGVDFTDANVRCDSATRKGRTIMFKGNQLLIRMFDFQKTPTGYGYLAHEIFHAVEFLMERIGMKLCPKSDEAFAYAIQYLTTEIHKRL